MNCCNEKITDKCRDFGNCDDDKPDGCCDLGDAFSICTLSATLSYDGKKFKVVNREPPIEDGVYNQFTIKDGCIVGVGKSDGPSVSVPLCCGEDGDGSGLTSVPISSMSGNLIGAASDGIYASIKFKNTTQIGLRMD